MTESLLYGIDVSHYQATSAPAGVPWPELAKGCHFAIVRATYGTWKDPSAIGHVTRAQDAGLAVGLYHFFRSSQPAADQLAAFCAAAHDVGLRAGDLCPFLDIEDDGAKGPKVDPAWQPAVQAMLDGLVAAFGEAGAYITQRDFGRLGKPAFVLARPLWVAHYVGAPAPATPANAPWRIWQHRVGPYIANGPGGAFQPMLLDQNRAHDPLPTCLRVPDQYPPVVPGGSAPQDTADERNAHRWNVLTSELYAGLDLSHTPDDYSPGEDPSV